MSLSCPMLLHFQARHMCVRAIGILFFCVIGTFVACAVILGVQYIWEMRRRNNESIAAKARRLRYIKSGDAVAAPNLDFLPLSPQGKFHIFLSHVPGGD